MYYMFICINISIRLYDYYVFADAHEANYGSLYYPTSTYGTGL